MSNQSIESHQKIMGLVAKQRQLCAVVRAEYDKGTPSLPLEQYARECRQVLMSYERAAKIAFAEEYGWDTILAELI